MFGTAIKLLYPTLNKKHTFKEFNVSLNCPSYYKDVTEDEKVIVLKSERNSLMIEVYRFENNFLSEIGLAEKLEDYKGLLKSVNYEGVVENDTTEIIELSGITCGKCTAEIKTINQTNKEKTVIIPRENGDLIISIHGMKEDMDNNEKDVEKILKSIKIK